MSAIDFFEKQKEEVTEMFQHLNEGDLVVLIQSQMFRLDDYRIRLRLFDRGMTFSLFTKIFRFSKCIWSFSLILIGIKNIEHVHLGNIPEEQYCDYINSLNFDPYGENDGILGRKIKKIIDKSNSATVKCHGGTSLFYNTPMVREEEKNERMKE